MHISSQLDFSATPSRVFAMMIDKSWLSELATRVRATESSVVVEGNQTRITMLIPTPSHVAKFAGKTMQLTQTISWEEVNIDGVRNGSMQILIAGLPAKFLGSAKLFAGGKGTLVDYQGNLEVNIPFIGKKLEQSAMPYMYKVINLQQIIGEEYLSNQPS